MINLDDPNEARKYLAKHNISVSENLSDKELTRIVRSLTYRIKQAIAASQRAINRALEADGEKLIHRHNKDEELLDDSWAMSFTKGLEHDPDTGLVSDKSQGEALREAINNGNVQDFNTITRPNFSEGKRQWEAPTAGFVFELEGPESQAVTMPPAPAINTEDDTFSELAFEMAEVYELALLRDKPFSVFEDGNSDPVMVSALDRLNHLSYVTDGLPLGLPDPVTGANRPRKQAGGLLTEQTVFRGSSLGAETGPYLSQFMLIGNLDDTGAPELQGKIAYGNQFIDQRVRNAALQDWMITWDDWLKVQNGANVRNNNDLFTEGTRFIHTPRDLATYVHDDALYQAYLNACLILLSMGAPFDPKFDLLSGMGAHGDKNTGGFALWGGPHILSLVTEVATRALKAVRYQKFQNHFRLRPEALAGRLAKEKEVEGAIGGKYVSGQFSLMASHLDPVMTAISAHNVGMDGDDIALLPMAFQEGSPMHPAYGAGHATVAGACVTVLKAFFDTTAMLTEKNGQVAFRRPLENDIPDGDPVQFITINDGNELQKQPSPTPLTLLGELNKLAANISIGRNMGGVHYFSDYYDSARMGEEIAVGILEEQAHGYDQNHFVMDLVPFDAPTPDNKVSIAPGQRITKEDLRSPLLQVPT